jgi:hypothetical protein
MARWCGGATVTGAEISIAKRASTGASVERWRLRTYQCNNLKEFRIALAKTAMAGFGCESGLAVGSGPARVFFKPECADHAPPSVATDSESPSSKFQVRLSPSLTNITVHSRLPATQVPDGVSKGQVPQTLSYPCLDPVIRLFAACWGCRLRFSSQPFSTEDSRSPSSPSFVSAQSCQRSCCAG